MLSVLVSPLNLSTEEGRPERFAGAQLTVGAFQARYMAEKLWVGFWALCLLNGFWILFSTHLMDHVSRLCSHAVILNEGAVIDKGSLDELRERHGEADLEDIFLKLTHRAAPA